MLYVLHQHFKEGGWGMWPVALVLVLIVGVTVERAWVLFHERADHGAFLFTVRALVIGGARERAISLCAAHRSAVARMTLAALLAADRPEPEVRAAAQQVVLLERPRLERRNASLVSLANFAAWLGLLGTLTGMVWCPHPHSGGGFGGWATIDPARKAELIAGGISEALNCTAAGLLVAVIALVSHAVLDGRAQALLDELDEAGAAVLHAIEIRRSIIPLPHPFRAGPVA